MTNYTSNLVSRSDSWVRLTAKTELYSSTEERNSATRYIHRLHDARQWCIFRQFRFSLPSQRPHPSNCLKPFPWRVLRSKQFRFPRALFFTYHYFSFAHAQKCEHNTLWRIWKIVSLHKTLEFVSIFSQNSLSASPLVYRKLACLPPTQRKTS